MHLWNRFISSVGRRGIFDTLWLFPRKLGVILSKTGDRMFDIRRGTDTCEIVELDQLDIQSPNKERGIRYEPTRARPFVKMMNNLAPPAGGGFVDFGCGKGRVLLLAADYGFKRITGVDFSKELCERANHNISTSRSRRHRDATFEILPVDAVAYEVKPDDTVFYFFNPFDEIVLGWVLDNITLSLAAAPRKIWIIYHNPLWSRVIERWSMFARIAFYDHAECEFVVYSNQEDPATP